MSTNAMFNIDTKKKWVNVRVNDLYVDGDIIGDVFPIPSDDTIPLSALKSEGAPGLFLHDNGVEISKKEIQVSDIQSLGVNAPNNSFLRHDNGNVTFETIDLPSRPSRHITVALSGGDFDSVELALNAAVLLSPNTSQPVEIQIYPGLYSINNPLTIPASVSLTTLSDVNNNSIVTIDCQNPGAIGFDLKSRSSIDGMKIINALPAISLSFGSAQISNITTENTLIGIEIFGGSVLIGRTLTITSGSNSANVVTGIVCRDGAKFFGNDIYCRNIAGTFSTAYRCDGLGSIMFLDNSSSVGVDICSGLTNGGIINMNGGRAINTTNVSHFIQSGSTLNIIAHEMVGTGLDLAIGSTSIVNAQACRIRKDRIFITPGGILRGNYFSDTPADIGMHIMGELSVGSVEAPSESSFGSGDSFVIGMRVYHCNVISGNLTNFVDITDFVSVNDGTTSGIFASTAIGQCLLIGSPHPLPGVKFLNTLGCVGAIKDVNYVIELSDGPQIPPGNPQFNLTNVMTTQANSPYDSRGDSCLETGNFQTRFSGVAFEDNINSQIKYWVRIRIIGSGITNGLVEQIKLHPANRVEINKDGFIELYNDDSEILTDINMNSTVSIGGSPNNQTLYLDSSLTAAGIRENEFIANANDRTSICIQMHSNTNTSQPLSLNFNVVPSSNVGNVVLWQIRAAYVKNVLDVDDENDPLCSMFYSSAATGVIDAPGLIYNQRNSITIPDNRANKLMNFKFDIDISKLICKRSIGSKAADHLVIVFSRLGNNVLDTYNGNIAILSANYKVKKWFL